MVSKIRSRLSLAITVAAVVFTLLCFVLPQVQTEQTIVQAGPTSPYGAIDYTFSGYVIPPVPAGSTISVGIAGYVPNSLTFSLFPSAGGGLAPTGPALVVLSNFSVSPFSISVKAPTSESYAIFISSQNRTSFLIGIEGTWSLFYVLRNYLSVGAFASVAAGLATYYFRIFEKRKAVEEAALKEATDRNAG